MPFSQMLNAISPGLGSKKSPGLRGCVSGLIWINGRCSLAFIMGAFAMMVRGNGSWAFITGMGSAAFAPTSFAVIMGSGASCLRHLRHTYLLYMLAMLPNSLMRRTQISLVGVLHSFLQSILLQGLWYTKLPALYASMACSTVAYFNGLILLMLNNICKQKKLKRYFTLFTAMQTL